MTESKVKYVINIYEKIKIIMKFSYINDKYSQHHTCLQREYILLKRDWEEKKLFYMKNLINCIFPLQSYIIAYCYNFDVVVCFFYFIYLYHIQSNIIYFLINFHYFSYMCYLPWNVWKKKENLLSIYQSSNTFNN